MVSCEKMWELEESTVVKQSMGRKPDGVGLTRDDAAAAATDRYANAAMRASLGEGALITNVLQCNTIGPSYWSALAMDRIHAAARTSFRVTAKGLSTFVSNGDVISIYRPRRLNVISNNEQRSLSTTVASARINSLLTKLGVSAMRLWAYTGHMKCTTGVQSFKFEFQM